MDIIVGVIAIISLITLLKSLKTDSRLQNSLEKVEYTARCIERMTIIVNETRELGRSTHELVNSRMSAQLLLTYTALARLANFTNNPDDVKAAEEAYILYSEHEKRQNRADLIGANDEDA